MLERLERQQRLTGNQWKIIATAGVGDMLDFFDFFLIGYVLAFILKEWHLTYGQSAVILVSAGLGAVPGALFWGWMGDVIGRRRVFILTALNVALATGVMYFTPGESGWVPGWLFLAFFRFFVGFGNAGLIAVDIPLVQEFVPTYKRGWVAGLTTVLLPGGNVLGAISGAFLAPHIGWRGLFLVGLTPALLVLMIRYWIPESPRFLMRVGRFDEARKALAWALNCEPSDIELPRAETAAAIERTSWRELFRYPRSMLAACSVALSQTGGVGILMWITALFVMVLKITPAEASYLMIWVGVLGICGRLLASWMSDFFGRRISGFLIGACSAVAMALAGYLHDVFIGTVSVFFVLIMIQRFFGDGSYAIIGPYIAEVWPNRLRASGMGFSYGVGNLGKIIGPLGLALVVGANDYVSPKATLGAIAPALFFLAFWYAQAAISFLVFGIETKGRSIEEIDRSLKAGEAKPALVAATSAGD
ncbi:MAG: MFS transporter [Alphaproteobacteria bacterium]|nr:MFS transporter [Alphaproteobacteria bacterium]